MGSQGLTNPATWPLGLSQGSGLLPPTTCIKNTLGGEVLTIKTDRPGPLLNLVDWTHQAGAQESTSYQLLRHFWSMLKSENAQVLILFLWPLTFQKVAWVQ